MNNTTIKYKKIRKKIISLQGDIIYTCLCIGKTQLKLKKKLLNLDNREYKQLLSFIENEKVF